MIHLFKNLIIFGVALCVLVPSALVASTGSPLPTPGQAAEAKRKPATSFEGKILKKKGKKVVINLASASMPKVGSKGDLLKYFKKAIFSGWLTIAEVHVVRVKSQKVVLKILKEKSKMKVNGKKVRHFKKGARIKLTLR